MLELAGYETNSVELSYRSTETEKVDNIWNSGKETSKVPPQL
jgi:hypothetical protein